MNQFDKYFYLLCISNFTARFKYGPILKISLSVDFSNAYLLDKAQNVAYFAFPRKNITHCENYPGFFG